MAIHDRHFALLGHLDSFARYRWFFEELRKQRSPDKPGVPETRLKSYLTGMPPSRAGEIAAMQRLHGAPVRGCYIDCYFNPEGLDDGIERRQAIRKVEKGCNLAADLGVRIAALGGFTSILGELTTHAITQIKDTFFTTGNTLTAYAVLQTVLELAERRKMDIEGTRVLVIGASGDIGSGCSRWLNGRVRHLDLVARNMPRLKKMAAEMPTTRTTVEVSTDINEMAAQADIVIAVASTLTGAFDPHIFSPKAIICDVGYPKNIKVSPNREGPTVVYGGMVRLPFPLLMDPGFLSPALYPNERIIHGCLGEGILLAISERYEAYSFGRGNITPERIDELGQMAKAQGLTHAPPHNGSGYLFPEEHLHDAPLVEAPELEAPNP